MVAICFEVLTFIHFHPGSLPRRGMPESRSIEKEVGISSALSNGIFCKNFVNETLDFCRMDRAIDLYPLLGDVYNERKIELEQGRDQVRAKLNGDNGGENSEIAG